ncbi:hypothetical protein HY989_04490, partial [Candidatus Micrarchaeota archaeon]|nr:hypothetical protein [Candidatus Micrarchaeota archaeon]
SGGFNVSILNSTVTTIASNDSTSFTFNSLSAGLSQLTFMSMYNTSATNATNATVIASQIVKMDVSQLTVSQASGNTYTLTLIGRDAYGNANNTLGFNVSSSNTSVTTNTTGGPTSFTFNSLSAGTSTLTYYSLANSSVTNQTNVTIVAGAISRLELSQLFPVTVAGSTYTITVNGRDNYGNINNSGGFNVSSSNSTVSINTTDSPSFTFNALASGNTTLTFMSIFNTSATNTTNSSVTSSGMVKVDISPIFPVRASGTNVTFTVTGRDVYGNAINTGGFIFSVSDGTVLSLITNTSTTAIYSGVIVGNSSFTVTSATNSTITNSTNASVIAGTVSQILLTPQAPLLSLGGTQQFTATAKDANFNTNSTVTITWARVNLVGTGAINSSGFFENTTGAGIVTINASYAAVVNLTNVTLAAGPITRIEISPLFPVNMSGKNFTFTLTGRDANGNTNNTGGFIFSVGDTTKLSLITNTSTTVIYSGVLSGNSSFTATSALDSSVTNSTNASVIAGIVSQILLTPQSPSLTVGASQQFTATAVDAAGNTNSTITINNWTLTNITGTAGLNTSGWLSNTTAGIVMVNASYFSISNLTNATISAAATPTPTPTTSSGGTGGNVGDSAPPSSTPTPTPEADDENEEKLPTVPKTVVIDDFTSVTGSFTETKTILDLDFNGGKNGFKGSIEYKLPLDYDDYVAGKITISPKPKSVKKGSVVVAWDVALAPLEDFKAKVTIDKRVAPSVLNQIAPPTTKLSQPTVKPTTAATAIPAATYQPPVQKPKTGGFGDYSIIVILAVLAILLAAYFYSQKVEKKRERL